MNGDIRVGSRRRRDSTSEHWQPTPDHRYSTRMRGGRDEGGYVYDMLAAVLGSLRTESRCYRCMLLCFLMLSTTVGPAVSSVLPSAIRSAAQRTSDNGDNSAGDGRPTQNYNPFPDSTVSQSVSQCLVNDSSTVATTSSTRLVRCLVVYLQLALVTTTHTHTHIIVLVLTRHRSRLVAFTSITSISL